MAWAEALENPYTIQSSTKKADFDQKGLLAIGWDLMCFEANEAEDCDVCSSDH